MAFKNYPKSREHNIVVQELKGELMIYDLVENKAFCLNETSTIVWQACDGEKTPIEISKILSDKLGSKANEDLVWLALEQFKKEKLIENNSELVSPFLGMSRREVVKKVGLGTMIALPIVASLVAPMGIHAASCIAFKATGCTAAPNTCCPNPPTLNCNTDGANMRCCLGAGFHADGFALGNATLPTNNCNPGANLNARDAQCNTTYGATCCSGKAENGSAGTCTSGPPATFSCVCIA